MLRRGEADVEQPGSARSDLARARPLQDHLDWQEGEEGEEAAGGEGGEQVEGGEALPPGVRQQEECQDGEEGGSCFGVSAGGVGGAA
jgi:hypothetical protein